MMMIIIAENRYKQAELPITGNKIFVIGYF